ncbi:hypothetical protein BOX15_Mlig033201g1, partial [Macrostomum lignano]
ILPVMNGYQVPPYSNGNSGNGAGPSGNGGGGSGPGSKFGSVSLLSVDPPNINERLPKEIILRVFSHLDLVTLCRCSQVCKFWHQLAFDGSIWQNVSLFEYGKDITGAMVETLAKRCGGFLRSLNLRGCQNLNDSAMRAFSYHCVNLERLNLSDCRKLTNEACKHIRSCQNLLSLKVNSISNISDDGVRYLAKCERLVELDMSWCNISDEGLTRLAQSCRHLAALQLRGCRDITSHGVAELSRHCTGLRVLSLYECGHNIRDEAMQALGANCPELRTLCLSHCGHVTDTGMIGLAAGCGQLRNLEVAGCRLLSDSGFQALARGCPQLERLDLEDCVQVTDITLAALAAHCSHLRILTLSYCELLTDDGIRQLAGGLCAPESLQVLELDNCPHITDTALEHLVACHALQQIDLYDCQQITRSGIRRLVGHLPNLKVHAYFAPVTPPGQPEPRRRRYCRCCCSLL